MRGPFVGAIGPADSGVAVATLCLLPVRAAPLAVLNRHFKDLEMTASEVTHSSWVNTSVEGEAGEGSRIRAIAEVQHTVLDVSLQVQTLKDALLLRKLKLRSLPDSAEEYGNWKVFLLSLIRIIASF